MEEKEAILIVDDDKVFCEHLKTGLDGCGYPVKAVHTAAGAIEAFKTGEYSLVLMNLVLPDIQGTALMRTLGAHSPGVNFIVFTNLAAISPALEALKSGAYDYMVKPFDIDHLKLVIKRGLEKQRLAMKNRELIERLEKEKAKLEVVIEAYKGIGGFLRLDELADFVTGKALQILEAERSSLMLVDEHTGDLVLKGGHGLDRGKLRELRMKLGDMVSGWVAREGRTLLVQDIDSDPRLRQAPRHGAYKTKSFISLPLKTDSHVLGVMNVTDKFASARVFTETDLKYLELLAHQTVVQIENIRLCEKLASMAVTDALTGIFNHRYFQEQLAHELSRAGRYGEPLSLIMFDIDSFKSYNDHYGHLEGDRVLKQVAAVTKESIRKADVVCRYGGDEFVVILPSTALRGASAVAQKIQQSVEKLEFKVKGKNKAIRVTISGGVAIYSKGMEKDELIGSADKLLYKAKSGGGNSICCPEK